MSIKIQSTTDSQEAVTAAIGDLAKEEQVETNSDSAHLAEETQEDSETSTEELEATDSEESQDDAESTEEEKSLKVEKKKGGFKKRIAKLSAKISEKDKEIEYWKSEAIKKQQAKKDSELEIPAKKAELSEKPKADDFETHEEFLEALSDWKVEKTLNDKEQKTKESAAVTAFQKKVEDFGKKVASFKETHDDFDDVMESVDDVIPSIAVQDLILDSENSAELAYELAKDKEFYAKICTLSPQAAAREMGRFEAKIQSSSKPDPKKKETKTTNAPPPLSTVTAKSNSGPKKSLYDDSLSQKEYEQMRMAAHRP